ncbi:MAP/microtubule affinity-regulating kinase 4 [Quaeritorhiza haematococci]|nr:MAP/microtubule affinity-regulating kinase 4 [Quaeritorhiza haematococci]
MANSPNTAHAPPPSTTPTPPPPASSSEREPSVVGHYRIDRNIGQGTYGKVKLAYHVHTGEKFAIKVIEKSQIQSPKQVARLQREIRFLKLLHHPHIVKVYDVIESADLIYIVMEYAAGGELFDYIVAHKRVREKEARSFFRMVLSAVDYCHQNAVIHRDLKPENLLLDEKKCIKIIDFGFGNNFTSDGLLDTFCGSPFYAAPEMILGKKYEGPEVDMWSLGVILFALLCGHLPFDDDNMKELYKKIAGGVYTVPDYLMPSARHLISRLITVDPKKRATLQEVLNHRWVNEGYDAPPPNYLPERPIITEPSQLNKEIVNRLLAFGYKMEEIAKAFECHTEADMIEYAKPNPIRATYFLLSEMIQREETRLRNERKRSLGSSSSQSDQLCHPQHPHIAQLQQQNQPTLLTKQISASAAQIPQNQASLYAIAEDKTAVSTSGLSVGSGSPHGGGRDHHKNRLSVSSYGRRDFGSMQVLPSSKESRRASTPVGHYKTQSTTMLNAPNAPSPTSSTQQSASSYDIGTYETNSTGTLNGQTNSPRSTSVPPSSQQSQSSGINITIDDPSRKPQNKDVSTGKPPFVPTVKVTDETKSDDNNNNNAKKEDTTTSAFPTAAAIYNQATTQNRRFSMPNGGQPTNNSGSSGKRNSVGKLREELRAVSGWFLNVSTTSSKPPDAIVEEVTRVLKESGAKFQLDGYIFTCEIDVGVLEGGAGNRRLSESSDHSAAGGGDLTPVSSSSRRPSSVSRSSISSAGTATTSPAGLTATGGGATKSKNGVAFQLEVCKVPRMNLFGLQFKRLNGGVWNYKKICNKLLSQMNLG